MPRAWSCRLWPEAGSRLYVRVLIFSRRQDLVRYWRRTGSSLFGRAQCLDIRRYYGRKRKRRAPIIAEITLWAGELDIGTLAHECAHAGFSWAARRRIPLSMCDLEAAALDPTMAPDHPEEQVVTVIGNLTEQLVNRATASGLTASARPGPRQ